MRDDPLTTTDPRVELRVDESGSANAATASDVDKLVMFRNDFELP